VGFRATQVFPNSLANNVLFVLFNSVADSV
jgi:hypothetical protein